MWVDKKNSLRLEYVKHDYIILKNELKPLFKRNILSQHTLVFSFMR